MENVEQANIAADIDKQSQAPKKSKLWIVILIVLIVAVLSSFGTYYFLSNNSQINKTQNPVVKVSQVEEVKENISQPQPTITPIINNDNFISNDLGISFNYDKTQAQVKQIGSKVYVYPNNTQPENGQWVEVFVKDKNDSLKTAIEKKFLVGYSSTDCFVTEGKNGVNTAIITVPTLANSDLEILSQEWKKCPEKYVTENGISYFLADPNYPDKFAYFSIGQYAIDSGISDKTWQDTFKFIK